MKISRPHLWRLAPGGISRERAMLLGAGLLAGAAILIAVDSRGLLDVGSETKEAMRLAGLALMLCGGVYLTYIWWADRFRISIGRLMAIIAMLAILIAVILHLRERYLGGVTRKPPGAFPVSGSGNGG